MTVEEMRKFPQIVFFSDRSDYNGAGLRSRDNLSVNCQSSVDCRLISVKSQATLSSGTFQQIVGKSEL